MNNKKIRRVAILTGLVFLLGVTLLAVAANMFLNKIALIERYTLDKIVTNREYYQYQGLPSGKALEVSPYKVTENYIYYLDRILLRYQEKPEDIAYAGTTISNLMKAVPAGVTKSFVPVPLRIGLEPGRERDKSLMNDTIRKLKPLLPKEVQTVEMFPVLESHSEEYIYFRTEKTWTSRGAYYGATAYLNRFGLTNVPISVYQEYMYNSFAGSLAFESGDLAITESVYDRVYYYLRPESSNLETLYIRVGDGIEAAQAPVIAHSRSGTATFVGEVFSHAIIKGDSENGKTLLIVGDDNGQVLAPWLIPFYETIYVINQNYYRGRSGEFQQIFRDYAVQDFILVEGMNNLGEKSGLARINLLLQ